MYGLLLGRCQDREKFDLQEARKFDCWLVRTIFIFCCPSQISTSRWRVARKSNFDSELDQFPLSWHHPRLLLGRRQDNRNRPNQESKFDFLATHQCLVKIGEGQQKIKIVRSNQQSNLWGSCQSIFSLPQHHPRLLHVKFKINLNLLKCVCVATKSATG